MAKQGVEPDDLTKAFFEAATAGRLVIQNCTACDRLQNPPSAQMRRVRLRRQPRMEDHERPWQDLQLLCGA